VFDPHAKMEGMFLHGAAHIFFENKLADTESQFNSKFKKFEQMFRDELKEMSKLHVNEMRKIRNEVKLLKIEVSDIRKSEEDLSSKGMEKISKLSKEVKTEVNEIKRIKSEVSQLKKEVSGIRQSEEDLTNIGMDSISKLSDEFKDEVKRIKSEIKGVKKDIGLVKEIKKSKKEREKAKENILENSKKQDMNKSAAVDQLAPIAESEPEDEDELGPKLDLKIETELKNREYLIDNTKKCNDQKEIGINFDVDSVRRNSQDTSDYHESEENYMIFNEDNVRRNSQETSDYHESDTVSDDDKIDKAKE